MEKIIKRRKAYQGKIVDVEKVDIDFGNNKKDTFELVNFYVETGITILPIDQKQNVYLIKQFKLGLEKRIICLPSGGLEPGKDPAKKANQELQEEVGLKSKKLKLMFRGHISPGYVGSDPGYFFLAQDLVKSKKKGDEVEEIQIIKLPFKEVVKMIKSGEIIDAKTIAAILYYKNFYK